jgi:formimidoylglutamase
MTSKASTRGAGELTAYGIGSEDEFMSASPNPVKNEVSDWACLGVPDQQGVIHVGGRLGAADGPAAFRKVWARFNGRAPVKAILKEDEDVAGLGSDIVLNHGLVAERLAFLQRTRARTVVVGGGHDIGFPHLQGVRDAVSIRLGRPARIGCINLDAHLDVRPAEPVRTSGSPFFLALEGGVLLAEDLVEFGIQSHCNAPALWTYVDRKGVRVIPWGELREPGAPLNRFVREFNALVSRCDAVVVSLDLDCIEQASAPGVSAPQAEGFRPSDILSMVEHAGAHARCPSLGIFELNPVFDQDDRTARIAATAAWHFIEAGIVSSIA